MMNSGIFWTVALLTAKWIRFQVCILVIHFSKQPTGVQNFECSFGAVLSQQNLVQARRAIKRSKALSACSPEQLPATQDANFLCPCNFLNEICMTQNAHSMQLPRSAASFQKLQIWSLRYISMLSLSTGHSYNEISLV